MEIFNIYCDESCHLENDGQKAMSLGAVWCLESKVSEVNQRIREIKMRNGINSDCEVKWIKASPGNKQLYIDLVDYFFDDDDLGFRGLVIPDKSVLNHDKYGQTHDEWYYKMYFDMLKIIFTPVSSYCIYVDIKDTNSYRNTQKLYDVCANDQYDFNHRIIKKIQPIRSDEVQIMQIVDIFTGALAYKHNCSEDANRTNKTKHDIISRISQRSGYNLTATTLPQEKKVNLLIWHPYSR